MRMNMYFCEMFHIVASSTMKMEILSALLKLSFFPPKDISLIKTSLKYIFTYMLCTNILHIEYSVKMEM